MDLEGNMVVAVVEGGCVVDLKVDDSGLFHSNVFGATCTHLFSKTSSTFFRINLLL